MIPPLDRSPAPAPRTLWLAVLLALGLAHCLYFTTLWDDAYISFRVAEHWAQSGEFSFNPGRPELVATNFLWTAGLAGVNKLTDWPIPRTAQVLGGLLGLLVPWVCVLGCWRLGRTAAAAPAGLLCVAAGVWAAWPLSGLETSAFTLAALGGVLGLLIYFEQPRRGWLLVSAAAWALATLLRPEGLGLFLLSWLMLAAQRPAGPSAILWYGAVYAAGVAPAAAFLWSQCHTVLPNAFYAKLHGLSNLKPGIAYLKDFLKTTHAMYWLPFVLPAFAAEDEAPVQARYLTLLLLGWAAWVAFSGGDFMPYHRFLAPAWPWLCLLIGLGLARLQDMLRRALPRIGKGATAMTYILAAFLAVPVLLPTFHGFDRDRVRQWTGEEADRARIGVWLAERYPPTDLLALKPAGIIPFYAGLAAVDFYGLLDRRAARTGQWTQDGWPGHQRIAVTRVLDLRPRLVILDDHLYPLAHLPEPDAGDGPVEQAWRADPRGRDYVSVRAEIAPHRWLQYFVRK